MLSVTLPYCQALKSTITNFSWKYFTFTLIFLLEFEADFEGEEMEDFRNRIEFLDKMSDRQGRYNDKENWLIKVPLNLFSKSIFIHKIKGQTVNN